LLPLRQEFPVLVEDLNAAALNLVVFRREILKSLEKVAGKGGVEKIF